MVKLNNTKSKIIIAIAFLVVLASLAAILVPMVAGAQEKGEIDVYLIAGQSNAHGFGVFNKEEFKEMDERFVNGFPEVLYWGSVNPGKFAKVSLGKGQTTSQSGAEIGIASAVADSGRQSAVIKVARGNTNLYPYTANGTSMEYGTWTSPSFLKAYGALNEDGTINTSATIADGYANSTWNQDNARVNIAATLNKDSSTHVVGNLYNQFINEVKTAVADLRANGYTPVLKGMWWMQGEAETWIEWADSTTSGSWLDYASNTQAKKSYSEALACLINDVRSEMVGIFGAEQGANMPFVLGKLHHNSGLKYDVNGNVILDDTTGVSKFEDVPNCLEGIVSGQELVAHSNSLTVNSGAATAITVSLKNVEIVDLANYENAYKCQRDHWHFDAKAQKWLGEQFVAKVNEMTGDAEGGMVTPYGTIPASMLSSGVSVAVFQDNECKFVSKYFNGDTTAWKGALREAAKYLGKDKTVQIYFLEDIKEDTYGSDSDTNQWGTNNGFHELGRYEGSLVIDLNAHSYTMNNDVTEMPYVIDAVMYYNNSTKDYGDINITVKNGTIQPGTYAGTLVNFGAVVEDGASVPDSPRKFNIVFDNIEYKTRNNVLFSYEGSTASNSMVEFNDCEFEIVGTASTSSPVFNTTNSSSATVSVKVYGSLVWLRDYPATTRLSRNHLYSGDVKFFESTRGGYFTVRFDNQFTTSNYNNGAVTAPNIVIDNSGVMSDKYIDALTLSSAYKYTFALTSSNVKDGHGHAVNRGYAYTALPNLTTKYGGSIPAAVLYTPEVFPMIVFDGTQLNDKGYITDGVAIGTSTVWANGDSAADTAFYMASALGANGSTSVSRHYAAILFRGDTTIDKTAYNNASNSKKAKIIIDFGGNTVTLNTTDNALLKLQKKSKYDIDYEMKNGTIELVSNQPLIEFEVIQNTNLSALGSGETETSVPVGFDLILKDLNIVVLADTPVIETIASSTQKRPYRGVSNTVKMYDCTFDLSGLPSGAETDYIIYDFVDGTKREDGTTVGYIKSDVDIYGGTIIRPIAGSYFGRMSMASALKYTTQDTGSDVAYYPSTTTGLYMGEYIPTKKTVNDSTTTAVSSAAPTWSIWIPSGHEAVSTTNPGSVNFVKKTTTVKRTVGSATYTYTLYQLEGDGPAVSTKYGNVPYKDYNDSNTHFVVFATDKTYIGKAATLNDNSAGAFYLVLTDINAKSGKTGYNILMLRDTYDNVAYSNMSSISQPVTVDLNKKTLYGPEGDSNESGLFYAQIKHNREFDRNITVTNGTIVNRNNQGIVTANAWGNLYGDFDKTATKVRGYNYTFSGVTFKFGNTASNQHLLVSMVDNTGKTDTSAIDNGTRTLLNVVYDNCTFNVTGAKADSILFNAKDTTLAERGSDSDGALGNIVNSLVNITVKGGKITGAKTSELANLVAENPDLVYPGTNGNVASIVSFEARNGKYTTIEVDDSVVVDGTVMYRAADGKYMSFVPAEGATLGSLVYSLEPSAVNDYKPLDSLTLHSQLVYNIYLPKQNLKSFVVDGKSYVVAELQDGDVDSYTDGNSCEYFRIPIALAANNAARDIEFSVVLDVDGTEASGSWKTSLVDYAERIIANTASSEVNVKLAYDVVDYLRSAYAYFGTVDADKTARMDNILQGYEDGLVRKDGTTTITKDNSNLAEVKLDLGAAPQIIFILKQGAVVSDSDTVTFKLANGNLLKYTFVSAEDSEIFAEGAPAAYYSVSFFAYAMCDEITYCVNGTDVGTFHINTYLDWADSETGYNGENKAALVDVVTKFYKYCTTALEYKNAIENA